MSKDVFEGADFTKASDETTEEIQEQFDEMCLVFLDQMSLMICPRKEFIIALRNLIKHAEKLIGELEELEKKKGKPMLPGESGKE